MATTSVAGTGAAGVRAAGSALASLPHQATAGTALLLVFPLGGLGVLGVLNGAPIFVCPRVASALGLTLWAVNLLLILSMLLSFFGISQM